MNNQSPFSFLRNSLEMHAKSVEQQSSLVKVGLVAIIAIVFVSHGVHRHVTTYTDCSSQPCSKTFIQSLFRGF